MAYGRQPIAHAQSAAGALGAARDAQWLREWIADPTAVDPFANMPAFDGVLTDEQMEAIANVLAACG